MRALNDTLRYGARAPEDPIEIFCECGETRCRVRFTLTLGRYEELRGSSGSLVAEEHADPLTDRIVGGSDGFVIVERQLPETGA